MSPSRGEKLLIQKTACRLKPLRLIVGQIVDGRITPIREDSNDIEFGSVELNGVPAVNDDKYGFVSDPEIKDRDDDGFPELMVKFPRDDVEEALDTGDGVEVTITGDVGDIRFKETDTIRVTDTGKGGVRSR